MVKLAELHEMCYNQHGDLMESMEFYDALYELRDAVRDHGKRHAVKTAYARLEADPDAHERLNTFMDAKQAFEKARQYGKHYPGYKSIARSFSTAKEALQTHPRYQEYMRCLDDLNAELKTLQDGIRDILDACTVNDGRACGFFRGTADEGKGPTS
jgi:cell fate (sporulation/competence/biofilm development) regulator YlbF (YheA/YmcA/DUF963 family)